MRIESNATDVVLWVRWDRYGTTVTELPSDLEVMEDNQAQRIKVVNEDGVFYINPLLSEDCEGLDLD